MLLLKRGIDAQVSDASHILGLHEAKANEKDSMKLTPLHYAALYNKPDTVRQLIKSGADVNACDVQGETSLHYAARYKQRYFQTASGEVKNTPSSIKVVTILIEAGAEINKRDIYGDTALFYAVLRGNSEAVDELLSQEGIDIESADHRKYTSLHMAARFNEIQIGGKLIEAGAKIRSMSDTELTPFMIACAEGNLDMCLLLITHAEQKGVADKMLDDKSDEAETALDLAIENRHQDIVTLCVEKGATVRKSCREIQSSPLHIAAAAGDREICLILLKKDLHLVNMRNLKGGIPLHRAAEYDREDTVHLMLDWDSDIEAKDHEGSTPLLTAVSHGSERATLALLRRGAHISALTKTDRSALHLAAECNAKNTLKILLEFARQQKLLERIISADDRMGNSPLHVAAAEGYRDIISILIENGADLENKNEDEEIPLHVAAYYGRTAVIKELLKAAKNTPIVNDTDEEENTPLLLAAKQGHLRSVQALLEGDADITHKNRFGWTALMSAAEGGWDNVVLELIQNKAEICVKDRTQNTSLHIAARCGNAGVMRILLDKGAPVYELDTNGHNPLDVAIKFGNKDVALTIIKSDQWRDALRNKTPGSVNNPDRFHTPLRKLIKKMPEVCEAVFDRCITYTRGMDVKDPDLEIICDYQFLDDSYAATYWGHEDLVPVGHPSDVDPTKTNQPALAEDDIYLTDGNLHPMAAPYTYNSVIRESNHPLQYLVDYKRGDLLYHPLVLALVRQKWKLAQVSYFSFLLYFLIFVTIFTSVMVSSKPPFMYNRTMFVAEGTQFCEELWNTTIESPSIWAIQEAPKGYYVFAALVLWILSSIGIIIEIGQVYSTPTRYLRSGTNLLDWFGYITVTLVMIPIHPCGIPLDWQWQLGAAAMFVSWMNLILFLRRLPGVGIYIVMVGEVFITFLKFFIFCFSLFIFAFGFTFFVVLRNQIPFQTPLYAFVKTGVMMIGEMEYEAMFHGPDEDHETTLFYEGSTFLLFIIFLCMVTIVIMNLLTGLAVGDVQEIQEQAKLKKLAMQVELSLDVETTLPEKIRRRLKIHIGHQCLHPNKANKSIIARIGSFMSGPLSSSSIAQAIYTEVEETLEEDEQVKEDDDDFGNQANSSDSPRGSRDSLPIGPTPTELELKAQLQETKEQLEYVMDGMDRMERMFKLFLEKSNVDISDV